MQQHLIKRQVFELTIPSQDHAQSLYSEVSAIFAQTIAPLIARCCDSVCHDDTLYQIEQLTIELADIDRNRLEQSFRELLEPALRSALQTQIKASATPQTTVSLAPDVSATPQTTVSLAPDASATPPATVGLAPDASSQRAIDLISYFLASGLLPWWADHHNPSVIADALTDILTNSPQELTKLAAMMGNHDTRISRLIAHLDHQRLLQFVQPLHPQAEPMSNAFFHFVPLIQQITGRDHQTVERQLWHALVTVSSRAVTTRIKPANAHYAQQLLQAIVTHCQVSHARLLTAIEHDTTSQAVVELREHLLVSPGPKGSDAIPTVNALIHQIINRWQSLKLPSSASVSQFWQRCIPDLPSSVHPATHTLTQQLATTRQSTKAIEQWAMALIERVSPATARQILQTIDQRLQLAQKEGLDSVVNTSAATEQPTSAKDSAFNDADDVAIGNAGLAMLAIFLPRFFQHLNLLKSEQFIDSNAAQRGVCLLQLLATDQLASAEYQLPLNKILCGFNPTDLIETEQSFSELEQRECTHLLESVLGHAPMLGKLSVEGFRSSFLLRDGLLKTDHHSWQLHVERQTFDVVLEQLPWQFQQIRLPWMPVPLTVEWL